MNKNPKVSLKLVLGADTVGSIGWMVNGGGGLIEHFDMKILWEVLYGEMAESMRFSIQQIIIIPFVEIPKINHICTYIPKTHIHTHTHTNTHPKNIYLIPSLQNVVTNSCTNIWFYVVIKSILLASRTSIQANMCVYRFLMLTNKYISNLVYYFVQIYWEQ